MVQSPVLVRRYPSIWYSGTCEATAGYWDQFGTLQYKKGIDTLD